MRNYINVLSVNRYTFCFKINVLLLLLLLTNAGNICAETKTNHAIKVVGYVKDAHSHKPIPTAQVNTLLEKGSAVTDDKGRFIITVTSKEEVLSISAYDFNQVEVAVKGRDSIVVELYSDNFTNYFKSIDGLTGVTENSTMVVSGKAVTDFKNSTAITADELLQTKLGADVRAIKRSGVAGIGSSLFIRGLNSLNANAQPLFVIDGVIWNNLNDIQSIHEGFFSNPLENIDVNDIETIEVLKDGVSIYGSKASNGVVLIKTKHSKTMVTKIGLNVFSGITTVPTSTPMMSGEDYRLYASDMLSSKGITTGNDVSSYGFLETNPVNAKVYKTFHNNTDWSKEVYQQSRTNSYLINAAGGDEKAKYYFSLGLTNNTGVVKTTTMTRINSRFNADFKLFKFMDMGLNIGFSNVERNLLDDGTSRYSSPTWVSLIKPSIVSPYSYTNQGNLSANYSTTDQFDIANPTALIKYSINTLKKYRFNIGVSPTFKLTHELTFSTLFDYSIDKTTEGRFVPMTYTPIEFLDSYGYSKDEVNSQVMRNTNVFNESKFTFQKELDEYNRLKAILGVRYINNFYELDYAEEHNTGANNITTITGDHDFLQVYGVNNYTKSLSNFLNVDYSFMNRYLLNGVVSMDASSRFGTKTKGEVSLFGQSWGVFPAVNAGWVISSEQFMKNVDLINFCKLRAGYGVTGNDGIQDYAAMAYFLSIRYMDKANGLVLSNLQNSKIQWETTARKNLGVDMNLLKNRISFTVDYFWSNTSDLLVQKDLPDVSGLGKYWTNSGKMTNNGFEIGTSFKVLNLRKLKWELGLNVAHYVNKITELPVGEFSTTVYGGEVISRVGEAAGSFYGYKTLGVFKSESEAAAADLKIRNADGTLTNFSGGDIIFEDKYKDGIIDEKDKQVIGNPNPDLYGNISSKISYDRFTLSSVFTYSYGNDVYNYKRSLLESGSDFSNQSTAMLRRWTANGQSTNQPKAVYGDPMGNARFSDRWIEDGSYIKLKTVTLSYDLPLKSNYIEGINIWVSVNNVFTITKYLGSDPEFSAGNSVFYQGVDAGLTPQTRSYFVGIKLNL